MIQKDEESVRNPKVKMVLKMVARESSTVVTVALRLPHYEAPVYVTSAIQKQGQEMLATILISVRLSNVWKQHNLIKIERCVFLIFHLVSLRGFLCQSLCS